MNNETTDYNLIDLGNLAIGIGTLVLAIVLGAINWNSAKRNRAIHIADKRQEWAKEFRGHIAEIWSMTEQFKEHLEGKRILDDFGANIARYRLLIYNLGLMFKNGNPKSKLMFQELAKSFEAIMEKNNEKHREHKNEAAEIVDKILEEQRQKIADLDSSFPYI